MSLNQALMTSASGLRVAQAGLALVSANVANAQTPGYVRKTLDQITTLGSGFGAGVRVVGVNRALDEYTLRQLRTETAGGSYADLRANIYGRLQLLFGEPGAPGTLESSFNTFTSSLQALTTSPESYSARMGVLNNAQVLAQQLNTMAAGVQGLRSEAENGIADSVARANEAMRQIADINMRISASSSQDGAAAVLADQRDRYIDELAELMDIRVVATGTNQVSVFTNSGVQLVGAQASQLTFDAQGSIDASAVWSADPTKRGVGTISLVSPNGDSVDLLASNSIRSGKMAAYVEMRDSVLVQAQAQLDSIAAGMAQALSDRTTDGTPATAGAQSGFDLDLSGMLAGNPLRVTYTDIASGEQKTVTFIRVDDPAALPLSNAATADPNDRVVGVNFAGGMGSVATQIAMALGADFTVSNPSGSLLRILDDGGVNVSMDAMSATKTTTGLTTGAVELPFFLDGNTPYSGAIGANGSQITGLAGRLGVNPALLSDPAKLVVYSSTPPTAAGDTARPEFILARLSQAVMTFPPAAGIGNAAGPFQASLPSFLREVISRQGAAAESADNLRQGQAVVVSALRERLADTSGVNIDQEMTYLLQLQASYSANARVLSAVKEMLDLLAKI
jgi:flagellar hook-associated protein 1 FlgK